MHRPAGALGCQKELCRAVSPLQRRESLSGGVRGESPGKSSASPRCLAVPAAAAAAAAVAALLSCMCSLASARVHACLLLACVKATCFSALDFRVLRACPARAASALLCSTISAVICCYFVRCVGCCVVPLAARTQPGVAALAAFGISGVFYLVQSRRLA